MSRTRALPVLLCLIVLLGADALWVMTHASATGGAPVVIYHSRIEGIDHYRGEVVLNGCGQLRGGISAGNSSEVSLDLTREEPQGSCTNSPQSFALMYDPAGGGSTLVGVRVEGISAPFEVLEEE